MPGAMPTGERRVLLAMLACFAVLDAAVGWTFFAALDDMYPDVFGTWSFARFVAAHPPARIYDPEALLAFQKALAPGFSMFFSYANPPGFLVLLRPMAWLGFGAAAVLWVGVTLAAFLLAAARLLGLRGADAMKGVAVLLLMPSTMLGAVYGQAGFLTGALLVGALGLLRGWPVAAGLLLGLLTVKPQMGVLVPVALVAGGHWRAVGGAIMGAALLAAASVAMFGNIWPEWLANLPVHGALVAGMGNQLRAIMATPLAGFLQLGIPAGLAAALHALCAGYAVVLVWVAFRRGVTPLAVAALLSGTFLVTPYGFAYDTPAVTVAVLLLCVSRYRAGREALPGETAILAFALVAPAFVLADAQMLPMVPASLLLLCGLVGWQLWGQAAGPAPGGLSE